MKFDSLCQYGLNRCDWFKRGGVMKLGIRIAVLSIFVAGLVGLVAVNTFVVGFPVEGKSELSNEGDVSCSDEILISIAGTDMLVNWRNSSLRYEDGRDHLDLREEERCDGLSDIPVVSFQSTAIGLIDVSRRRHELKTTYQIQKELWEKNGFDWAEEDVFYEGRKIEGLKKISGSVSNLVLRVSGGTGNGEPIIYRCSPATQGNWPVYSCSTRFLLQGFEGLMIVSNTGRIDSSPLKLFERHNRNMELFEKLVGRAKGN